MQGRVDARCSTVEVEEAVKLQPNYFVFKSEAPITVFQLVELFNIESGNAFSGERADVAAGAFHPYNLYFFTGKGVSFDGFAGGISATKIGDAKVGAQDVGAVEEEFDFVPAEGSGFLLVPMVVDVVKF